MLVVDDELGFLKALRRRYEQKGFDVRTAGSRDVARSLVIDWTPDVCIVDLHLDELNEGLLAIEGLRGLCPDAWIVLVSAAVSGSTGSEARNRGADAVVEKPADTMDYLGLRDRGPESRFPTFEQLKRALFELTLRVTDGDFAHAARLLGVDRRTVTRNVEKWRQSK